VLLVVAYRRWRVPVLAPLPLATAALSGLAAVGAVYGNVHGITLAFGFTLIGVAQDYPIHLFSHQHAGFHLTRMRLGYGRRWRLELRRRASPMSRFSPRASRASPSSASSRSRAWPWRGSRTRYLLPRMTGEDFRDPAQSPMLERLEQLLSLPHVPPAAYAVAMGACLAIALFAPGPAWQDDLGALTPVPPDLLAQDARLRAEIGAPDPRFLAVVSATDTEAALQKLELLQPGLDSLVNVGAIAGYEHAGKYLPSIRRQRIRQGQLPTPAELASALPRPCTACRFALESLRHSWPTSSAHAHNRR
jgi:predicted exporter